MHIIWDTFNELDYYDGPLMFSAKTSVGTHVFGVWIEESDEGVREFLVVELSLRELTALVEGCATIYEMQRKSRRRFLWNLHRDENELRPVEFSPKIQRYFSDSGCRLTNYWRNPREMFRQRANGSCYWIKANNRKGRHKNPLKRFCWRYKSPWPGSHVPTNLRKFKSVAVQAVMKAESKRFRSL